MCRISILIALFVILRIPAIHSQNIEIKGKVTNFDNDSPLHGVSVLVKGTTIKTLTDSNGSFQLTIPIYETKLLFSINGMKKQEISISGQTLINCKMIPDCHSQDDSTSIVFGIKRLGKTIGYSSATFNFETFNNRSQIDIMSAVQGKVAGVIVTSGGGMPGASTKVIIRGYSSFSDNNPLFVIDGMPVNNSFRTGISSGLDFGNRANDINPDDIEHLTILKGVAAISLYGSRAASGAVIITTKQGNFSDKLRFEVSSSISTSDVLRIPRSQNIFGQGLDGLWSPDANSSWGPAMDGNIRAWGNIIDAVQKIKPYSPVKENYYDFFDYGMQYTSSVNMSGGNKKSTYYLSFNNVNADGTIPTKVDKNLKNSLTFTNRIKFKKLITLTSIHYVNHKGRLVPNGFGGSDAAANLYTEILQIPRNLSIVDLRNYKTDNFNKPDYYFTPYSFNPYFALNENQSEFSENRIFGNTQFDYKFSEWISLTWRIGTDVSYFDRKDWEAILKFNTGTPNYNSNFRINQGNVLKENRYTMELNSDLFLNYSKIMFSDLKFDGFVGFNLYKKDFDISSRAINSLKIPSVYNLENSDSIQTVTNLNKYNKQYGYFGAINVNFKGIAFLNFSLRNDILSTLPKDESRYFYPSASVSILLTEIIPPLKDYIQLFKFRTSSGKAGSYNDSGLPPLLSKEKETGADIHILDNRVLMDIAFYNKISEGQIISASILPTSVPSQLLINFCQIQNRGIEIESTFIPVQVQNFQWNFSAIYSRNRNEVIDLSTQTQELALGTINYTQMVALKGRPLGVLRCNDYLRDEAGHIIVNSSNGLPKRNFVQSEVGNVLPKFVLGLTNDFKYKNFDFSFVIDWRKGGYMYSGTADLHYFAGNATGTLYNNRQPFIVPNSVKDNPFFDAVKNPDVPQYVENDIPVTMVNVNAYYYPSSAPVSERDRIIPRDYLKLRDVSVAYTIPSKFISKLPVEKISLVLSGRNLLLFTPGENNFIDPESTSFGNDLISEMGEFRTGPTLRTFTGSIRINF